MVAFFVHLQKKVVKNKITEKELKNLPSGGALIGKREGQTIVHKEGSFGGYLSGRLHKEDGIKGVIKTDGNPIEMQGGEVVITAPAVADTTLREFEGEMLTNREILSRINSDAGGVSFEDGGEIKIKYSGKNYNYGGQLMTDKEIIDSCGCGHKMSDGGKVDKLGNFIGDGKYHVHYKVYDFENYPQVSNSVSKSQTTESVYVTYFNEDNSKKITVRFSNHISNAVKFGDELDGNTATKEEILYHLGLYNRTFIPNKILLIETKQIKMKDKPNFQESDLTIKEMYSLGANADLSKHKGKVAKGSNYLILGDKVEEHNETRINAFGRKVEIGKFIYEPLNNFENGGHVYRNKFIKWFNDWYKKGVYQKMNITISIATPENYFNYHVDNHDVVVLDLFEKIDQNIDAKKYLQEIIEKADEFNVVILAEAKPRHKYFLNNPEKRRKVTITYLKNYYQKFGFEKFGANNLLVRLPKNNFNKGGVLFHGTPHNFEKFSTDKIGTGEGVQAFGWGLYFTKLKDIAKNYSIAISTSKTTGGRKEYYSEKEFDEYLSTLTKDNKIKKWAKDYTGQYFPKLNGTYYHILNKDNDGRTFVDVVRGIYNNEKIMKLSPNEFDNLFGIDKMQFTDFAKKFERNIYEVSFKDDKKLEDFIWMDWDKKINSELQNKINLQFSKEKLPEKIIDKGLTETSKILRSNETYYIYRPNPISTTGENFYNDLITYFSNLDKKNPAKEASLFLLRSGIMGIKYPAETISKGANSDTAMGFNYVVFDDSLINIENIEKFELGGSILLAPNGKPSNLTPEQWHLVRTPEFKEWFGDWENDPENASKVVDENGEPLVVYHGSKISFNTFKNSHIGETTDTGYYGYGFYFTPSKVVAAEYGVEIKPYFLNIKKIFNCNRNNPFYLLGKEITDKYLSLGYDGSSITLDRDKKYHEYCVFYKCPENIKLADGTNVTFDFKNDDIRFELGGNVLLAPNGKPSNLTPEQWHLVRTPEFKEWFGDWENDPENASKIVDKNGEPLIVYRSQNDDRLQNVERQSKHFGIYFSENKESTKKYGNITKSYFLNIKNPIILKDSKWNLSVIAEYLFKHLKEKGYDGAIWDRKSEMYEIVAFDLNQIKLADGTNITFDKNNPDIRFELGGNILLAPNGKPSNLTPEQWHLVRTPKFKEWFGDWENDPENASKVVDKNGEPLVVYHGSPYGDIRIFDRKKSKRNSSGLMEFGTYFATNKKLAELYKNYATLNKDFVVDTVKEIEKLQNLRYDVKNVRDWEKITNEIDQLYLKITPKIYPVFLKLDSIFTFDAKGENNIEAWYNLEVKASYKIASGRDAMKFLKEGLFGVDKVEAIKAENIVDAFRQDKGSREYNELLGDVFLVFDDVSNFAKLADGTNTTFDKNNPDINYEDGGSINSYKNQYNHKFGYKVNESHSLEEISNDTGYSIEGLQQIYNKGIGAYKSNPESVRPTVHSKEQWAMGRVYSAVMGGKAALIDHKELKFKSGGNLPLLAPNGNPSNLTPEQWHLVRTPEFKQWFGDWEKLASIKINDSGIDEITLNLLSKDVSKVVDENGEPLVVYHGSGNNFSIFSDSMIGSNYTQSIGGGFFFTQKKQSAENYSILFSKNSTVGYVYECFLNLKNPLKRNTDSEYVSPVERYDISYADYNHEKMRNENIDGIAIIGTKKDNLYVVVKSNQIKLADGRNTTFDSKNDDIRFEKGGVIKAISDTKNYLQKKYSKRLISYDEIMKEADKYAEQELKKNGINKYSTKGLKLYFNLSGANRKELEKKYYKDVEPIFDTLIKIYVRLGLPPKNNKGQIKNSTGFNDKIKLNGLSVFEAGYDPKSKFVIINTRGSSSLTLDWFEGLAQKRKIYLIEGIEMDEEGFDGEPLLITNSVKVIGELDPDFVVTDYNSFDNSTASNKIIDKHPFEMQNGGIIKQNEIYQKWLSLVNMTKSELKLFYYSDEGKAAGLSEAQAAKLGIHSGRESARWVMKMKDTPVKNWTSKMWEWAKRQISFISRMKGNKGELFDENGNKTRKHTSLLIWGHNPLKKQ